MSHSRQPQLPYCLEVSTSTRVPIAYHTHRGSQSDCGGTCQALQANAPSKCDLQVAARA